MSDHDPEKPIGAGKSSFELVDSDRVFDALGVESGTVFLDVACGFGHYSLEAADRVGKDGHVYAFDLWEDSIAGLNEQITRYGLTNISARIGDVSKKIEVGDDVVDSCLLSTVLHDFIIAGNEKNVLGEVARVVKSGGTLGILEFEKIEGPPGPPREIRLTAAQVVDIVVQHGFSKKQLVDVGPYNYLVTFTKESSS